MMRAGASRYNLGGLLGEGGMGRVLRARDEVLGADVALKVLRPELSAVDGFRRRFELEMRLAARVSHPHVLPLHDVGTLPDGSPYLAMPLAGGSLADWRGDWTEALPLLLGVLDALSALHALGVVHRDLKPANVLLWEGRAAVADLGLADVADTLARRLQDRSGTPAYMPPEQREGRTRLFGPPLDLFAFGAIVRDILGGCLVPEGLPSLLGTLLAPSPHDRPALAADVRRALLALGPPDTLLATEPDRDDSATVASFLDLDPPLAPGAAPPPAARRDLPPPGPLPERPPALSPAPETRISPQLFVLRETPLVGREVEQQILWDAARRAARLRRPVAVVIAGEAGAGKSRLADWLCRTLEISGHARTVRVTHRGGRGPDEGIDAAVRRVLRAHGGESREVLRERIRAQLAGPLGAEAEALADALVAWSVDGHGPDLPRRFLLRWLRAEAGRGLAVLYVDDAQWSDADSGLELVRALLDPQGALADVPLLVVATCRTEELDARELTQLEAHGATVIRLARLGLEATRALVARTLTLEPGLAELVATRCEGNPLLARQLLLHWVEIGALHDEGMLRHGIRPGCDATTALPEGASDLFLARLAAVVDRGEASLADAVARLALAGHTLPLPVFRRLAGPHAETVLAAGLVRREGGDARWDHALLHETVRAQALAGPAVEVRWREVADAWEAWTRETGRAADGPLGLARYGAGDPGDALEPLLRACRVAMLDGSPGYERLSTAAMACAEALHPDGDRDGLRAKALLFHLWWLQRIGRAHDTLAPARAALELSPPPAWAGRLWSHIGHVLLFQGQFDEAERCLVRGVELADEGDDPAAVAMAYQNLALLRMRRGALDQALVLQQRAVDALAPGFDEAFLHRGLRALADIHLRRGDREGAAQIARDGLARAQGLGAPIARSGYRHLLARIAMDEGEIDLAEAHLQRALDDELSLGLTPRLPMIRCTLGRIRFERGDLDGAAEAFEAHYRWAVARMNLEEAAGAALNLVYVVDARRDAARMGRIADDIAALGIDDTHWSAGLIAALRARAALLDRDRPGLRHALDAVPDGNVAAPQLGHLVQACLEELADLGWEAERADLAALAACSSSPEPRAP